MDVYIFNFQTQTQTCTRHVQAEKAGRLRWHTLTANSVWQNVHLCNPSSFGGSGPCTTECAVTLCWQHRRFQNTYIYSD